MRENTKRSHIFIALLLLAFNAETWAQSRTARHTRQVKAFQAQRERDMRDPDESALEPADIAKFKHLDYFPVSAAYRVRAHFVRMPDETKFDMPTSNPQKQKRHVKYGELHFKLHGRAWQLNVYQNEALLQDAKYKNYLFLPFTDETSGKETYGGGRYLDLEIPAGDTITLDFNLAYQPNCAYNHSGRWSCPIPPRENRLPVAVRAGERLAAKRENIIR